MAEKFYSGYVGIIGRPNVGKSTLLNAFLGEKISIVTPKPQTTRHRIMGILTLKDCQMIFLDTPGILEPHYQLHQNMVKCAWRVLDEADVIVFMVEPVMPQKTEMKIIEHMTSCQKPRLLVINKIDTIQKDILLPLIESYAKMNIFQEIIPVSALKLKGTDSLLESIKTSLPEGAPFYPEDMITDKPERFFAAEIIREKIFKYYQEEIPYSTTVVIEEFKERKPKDYIHGVIYVERESQEGILIGGIKKVAVEARKDIEELIGREVYLELWVKTRKNWRKSSNDLKEFGYE
ncbi:GTPase Era [Candidatus Desantisbacteria bacterium]|nr:GTPase Era [Candidatus Desantisbacteria bacterium]